MNDVKCSSLAVVVSVDMTKWSQLSRGCIDSLCHMNQTLSLLPIALSPDAYYAASFLFFCRS